MILDNYLLPFMKIHVCYPYLWMKKRASKFLCVIGIHLDYVAYYRKGLDTNHYICHTCCRKIRGRRLTRFNFRSCRTATGDVYKDKDRMYVSRQYKIDGKLYKTYKAVFPIDRLQKIGKNLYCSIPYDDKRFDFRLNKRIEKETRKRKKRKKK